MQLQQQVTHNIECQVSGFAINILEVLVRYHSTIEAILNMVQPAGKVGSLCEAKFTWFLRCYMRATKQH